MKEYVELEKADVDAITVRATETEVRLKAAESQLDGLKKTVADGHAAQGGRLAALEKDRASLDARLKAVETWPPVIEKSLLAFDVRMKKAEADAISLDARLDKAEPEVVSLDDRLDKVEPALSQLSQRLDANETKDRHQDAADVSLGKRNDVLEKWQLETAKVLADYAARLAKLEKPVVAVPVPTTAPGQE